MGAHSTDAEDAEVSEDALGCRQEGQGREGTLKSYGDTSLHMDWGRGSESAVDLARQGRNSEELWRHFLAHGLGTRKRISSGLGKAANAEPSAESCPRIDAPQAHACTRSRNSLH